MKKTSLREVNCEPYRPVVEHPHVARLGDVPQLSFVYHVYLGAKHSRIDHTVFVLHFTREITNHLVEYGCIDKTDKRNLECASVLHDTGHAPESHAFEFVAQDLMRGKRKKFDHKTRAIELIEDEKRDRSGRTLRQCIEECNCDPDFVEDIILKKTYLSQVISHNTLGSDKTGYVLLDSNRTNYNAYLPFFLDIFPYYYYDGKKLGLSDNEKETEIRSLQEAYQNMYIDVYFHPTVRYFERLFEKAIQILVEKEKYTIGYLWTLEDCELKSLMKNNKKTGRLFEKMQQAIMDERVLSLGYYPKKGLNKADINFYSRPLNLSSIEKNIAEEYGCAPEQITGVITCIPERIIPEDVYIFDQGYSIFEKYPSFKESLDEKAWEKTRINLFAEPGINLDAEKCERIIKATASQ